MSRLKLLELMEPPNGVIIGMSRLDHDVFEDEVILSDGTVRDGFRDASIQHMVMELNKHYPEFVESMRAIMNDSENVIYVEIRSWKKPNHDIIYDFIQRYNERLTDLRKYIYLERFIEPPSPRGPRTRRSSPKSKKTKVKRDN
jgi:hypothetical protein